MKFANWPPQEYVPATRPEALSLDLVDGNSKDIEERVDAYVKGLHEYATENNIYVSDDKRALAGAQQEVARIVREIAGANNIYEKQKFENRLKSVIEKINGTLTENLVASIETNKKRLEDIKNATPNERQHMLENAVEEVQAVPVVENPTEKPAEAAVADKPEEAPEATPPYVSDSKEIVFVRNVRPEMSQAERKAQEDERFQQREAIADTFAKKFNIQHERSMMLDAEAAYAEAVKKHNAKGITVTRGSRGMKQAQDRYDQSLSNWQNALTFVGASENATPQDAITAKFIGIRDTSLRMGRVRQEAQLEGIDEKGKTLFGKLQNWVVKDLEYSARDAGHLAKAYSNVAEKVGGVIVKDVVLRGVKAWNKEFDEEKHAAKIQRASKIVGSAAITSLIAAPLGAATAGGAVVTGLSSFLFRVMRGSATSIVTSGILLGVSRNADKERKNIVKENVESKKALMHKLRSKDIKLKTVAEMRAEREEYQKATAAGLVERLQKSESKHNALKVGAVGLQAGVVFGFSHLPSVDHAIEVLHNAGQMPLHASSPFSDTELHGQTESTSGPTDSVAPPASPVEHAPVASKIASAESVRPAVQHEASATAAAKPPVVEEVQSSSAPTPAAATAPEAAPASAPAPEVARPSVAEDLPYHADTPATDTDSMPYHADTPAAAKAESVPYTPLSEHPPENLVPKDFGAEPTVNPEPLQAAPAADVPPPAPAYVPEQMPATNPAETVQPISIQPEATPEAAPAAPAYVDTHASEISHPDQPTGNGSASPENIPDTAVAPEGVSAVDIHQQPIGSSIDHTNTPDTSSTASAEAGTSAATPETDHDTVVVSASSVFENKFHVPIDPKTPHFYELKGDKDATVAFGGTAEERLTKINTFLSDPANYNKRIYAEGTAINPETGRPFVNMYRSNGEEGYVVAVGLTRKHGGFLGLFTKTESSVLPDTDTFTKLIA